jgi:hypothetical protein
MYWQCQKYTDTAPANISFIRDYCLAFLTFNLDHRKHNNNNLLIYLFVITDCGFDIFHLFGGKKESAQIPSTVQTKEVIQSAIATQTKEQIDKTITAHLKEDIQSITSSEAKEEIQSAFAAKTKEHVNKKITTNPEEHIQSIANSETKEEMQITVNQQASDETSEGNKYNWSLGLFHPGGNQQKVTQQGTLAIY